MDKKLSTFQIILLCVFGAVGVSAILVFALVTASGSASTVGPVTIWGTLDATTMKNVLRLASEEDPGLSQVTYVQEDASTSEQDLANALASGKGPDIFIMPEDEAIYDSDKVYLFPYTSTSQSAFQSTFVEAANSYLSQSGIIALPMLVDPLVLYWNRDLLASAGISQPPQYWDQVPGMMTELAKKDTTGDLQQAGIALGTYQNIDGAKDILSMLIEQAGVQITGLNSSGAYVSALAQGGQASQGAVSALQFYTEFADPSKPDYTWNDAQPSAQQAFAAGQLAMYIGYASEESQIIAANPNLDFAIAPVPEIQNSAVSVDEGKVYGLAIPKNDPNRQNAVTVADIMVTNPFDAEVAQAYGLAPSRRDAIAESTSTDGDVQLFNKMALITHTWVDPDPSQTDPIFQAMIEDTDNGSAQAANAIGTANEQIGNLFSQQQGQ